MNSDQISGKWKQIKGAVRERWGKLTDDDVEVIAGQNEELVGRIQERYGIAQAEAQKQVDEWRVESGEAEFEGPELEERRQAS